MSLPRRALLRRGFACVGFLGAGCVASPSDDPTRTDGATPTGTDGGPTVSLAAVDDPPALPVRPSVAVVDPTATDAHPPQVRVTVTNRSDGTVTAGEGREIVFAYVTDGAGALTLLPTDGAYPVEAGCWRLREPIAVTQEYRTVTLAPGEAVSRVQGVYGAAGGTDCLPTGTFRFAATYRVTAGETTTGGEEGRHATWGFSLSLS
ncbi:MAG: hypothetical protein ABEJ81_04990 [Haloferacaceae archaeon]